MASVEKRIRNGRKTWRVAWRDPEGRQRSRVFDVERDAKAWRADVERSINRGQYYDSERGKITVGDWADLWFGVKVDLDLSTRERYAGIIRVHIRPRWGRIPLARVGHAEVQRWVAGIDLAPATVRKIHDVLSMMFDYAVRDGRIVRNPCDDIVLPRVEQTEKRFLDHRQLAELADEAGKVWDGYRLQMLFLGYTGLRWGEMAALRASRLDLDRRRAAIVEAVAFVKGKPVFGTTKGHERREVPLPRFLAEELRAHVERLGKDDLVFRGKRGAIAQAAKFQTAALIGRAPMWGPAVRLGLCDWEETADGGRKPVRVFHPHELRHTAASLAIASGADVKVVQQMLGHKTAAMTLDLYGHLFPDRLDLVADAMDAARTSVLGAGVARLLPRSVPGDPADGQPGQHVA